MRHLLPILLSAAACLPAGDAPVAIGRGSYAPQPPGGNKEIAEQLARKPLIEAESAGRPLPSNDWWTSLLANPWPGKLYARPAIVSAHGGGARIWYPQGWDAKGSQFEEGPPLDVLAVERTPSADADQVLADFEWERWPKGWEIEGRAWGEGPATTAQQDGEGVLGKRWAMGFANGGDGATGTATGPAFRIERGYIHLLVAGGKDGKARIELLVDGKPVQQAVGRNSRTLAATVWDVRQLKGKQARLRLVDETGGGWGWIGVDQVVASERAEAGSGGLLRTCSTLRWGDWNVAMRLRADEQRFLDVTIGHGMPYVWIESAGLDLRVPCDAAQAKVQGDVATITLEGRGFALFAPEKAVMKLGADGIDVAFPAAGKRWLVVGLLPTPADLPLLRTHAYAVPRDTRFDWKLDMAAGEVQTSWTVRAEALRGTSTAVLQGWLPHQWRNTRHALALEKAEFPSPRGRLRLAPGQSFAISWPFRGVVPMLPAPAPVVGAPAFEPARATAWLDKAVEDYAKASPEKRAGGDTYWGAKATLKLVQVWTIAEEAKHPAAPRLKAWAAEAMADWLTWTPGERERYFCRYPAPWSALVGLNTSFGSGGFTDNHFHYGYLTLAAALIGRYDRAWLEDYGPMARLVAKQYANWQREDRDFPYLRTFDPWHGHSYAGGMSNPGDGNNQESTSESMQAWAGLFLLGSALGDADMAAAGAMGYAIESSAVMEYWFDREGWKDPAQGVHAPAYRAQHTMASVVRDRDVGFWTWFSGRPIHVYGIQFIPTWHWMSYLGRDAAFMDFQAESMAKRELKRATPDWLDLGDDWGSLAGIGAMSFGDPRRVTGIFADAAAKRAKLDGPNSLITWWVAHTQQAVGATDATVWTDLPTSAAYRQPDGAVSVAAWNPAARPATVRVVRDGKPAGTFTLAPGELAVRPLGR